LRPPHAPVRPYLFDCKSCKAAQNPRNPLIEHVFLRVDSVPLSTRCSACTGACHSLLSELLRHPALLLACPCLHPLAARVHQLSGGGLALKFSGPSHAHALQCLAAFFGLQECPEPVGAGGCEIGDYGATMKALHTITNGASGQCSQVQ
jgi:hypothetical protein